MKVAEHSFAGGQQYLAWQHEFKIKQTNIAAKKQWYTGDNFSKSTNKGLGPVNLKTFFNSYPISKAW